MAFRYFFQPYFDEFHNYNLSKFRQDLFAGLTVAAVALPLALAFGAASGATPSAGMVTAILAGLVIGCLSGAPYQISGPTGAMSAVLILLAQQYGLSGVWMAGALAGLILIVVGILRLGRLIAFIPACVVTGFTSGIALIIAIGQLDNLLSVQTPEAGSSAAKFLGYFHASFTPDWRSLILGGLVIAVMLLWPKKWNGRFPASLLGIILATVLNSILQWPVKTIGEIPQTLLLSDRLSFSPIPWDQLPEFIGPALTIAALGAIESLLCGAVASKMTDIPFHANQELIAQGIGNILIPFFGGVPATAAIARSSVGIKSGGQTRLVSLIHALALLASMFILAPVMSQIPLAALAGVLMVTAWRMNEWEAIEYLFGKRLRLEALIFAITMLATITLDLTEAILIGAVLSAVLFLNKSARMEIQIHEIVPEKLRQRGIELTGPCQHMRVAYLTGPLFFAATGNFNEAFTRLTGTQALILSMRGVPLIDFSGMQAMRGLHKKLEQAGSTLMLAGVHDGVRQMMERVGFIEEIGAENIFWSSDQAILAADQRRGSA